MSRLLFVGGCGSHVHDCFGHRFQHNCPGVQGLLSVPRLWRVIDQAVILLGAGLPAGCSVDLMEQADESVTKSRLWHAGIGNSMRSHTCSRLKPSMCRDMGSSGALKAVTLTVCVRHLRLRSFGSTVSPIACDRIRRGANARHCHTLLDIAVTDWTQL